MGNGIQKRKTGQKGVLAIFTSDVNWKTSAELTLGLLGLILGAFLWILPLQTSGSQAFQLNSPSQSLIIVPSALVLVTGGVGLVTYALVIRKTRKDYYRIESALYKLEALVGSKEDIPLSSEPLPPHMRTLDPASQFRISKSLVVAVVQGIVLIILYGGLVAEYRSNIHMQTWVQSNISVAGYLLNEAAVGAVGVIMLGVLIAQWLSRKRRSLQFTRIGV